MSGLPITGATRLYAIVGDPIGQVRSPEVYTERFRATGLDAVLVPVHVPADRFDEIVPGLMRVANLHGVLVTVPFKARMTAFAQRLGETAQAIGAVNALRREADGSWSGDMFDGIGFVRGIEAKGQRVRGRSALLFGCGGAGAAIAFALAIAGVRSIRIVDPQKDRAVALVETLRKSFPSLDAGVSAAPFAAAHLIVNASTVGMREGDGMPGDIGPLSSDVVVGDVVLGNKPTPLIEHALRHGCAWADGRDMHAGQVEAIMSFFTSAGPSRVEQRSH
jgi:shikimate dehydrogenase